MIRLPVLLFLISVTLCRAESQWTVMLFLNGDNDLDLAAGESLKNLMKVGSTPLVNFVALQDHAGNGDTERHFVEKGRLITESVGEIDMGDWHEALNFFRWSVQNYPARHYFYIIWDHGMGWIDWLSGKNKFSRDISLDATSGHCMSTPDLRELSSGMHGILGRKIDVLGYDACLMANLEVAWETAGDTDFIVFSEEIESARSWPYHMIFPLLVEHPETEPEAISIQCVLKNTEYYQSIQAKATLSAVDCSKLTDAAGKFESFLTLLINNPHLGERYRIAISQTQSFAYLWYRDLCDVVKKMGTVADMDLQGTDLDLIHGLEVSPYPLIICSGHTGAGVEEATGLSIYLPDRDEYEKHKKAYKNLKFCGDTLWDEFLETLYYPKSPIPVIDKIELIDENGDGSVAPSESVRFKITLSNKGLQAASLKIMLSASSEAVIQNSETYLEISAGGEAICESLSARIAPDCPEGNLKFGIDLSFNGRVMHEKYSLRVHHSFAVKNRVLLILKKSDTVPASVYRAALSSAGIKFDLWDPSIDGKITFDTLGKYTGGAVILAETSGSDLVDLKLAIFTKYLDAGGSLLACGQDWGRYKGTTAFYQEYLGAKYLSDDAGENAISGCNEFSGISGALSGSQSPDQIESANAEVVFRYTGGNPAGLFHAGSSYKTIYLAFGLETLSSETVSILILSKAVRLLLPDVSSMLKNLSRLELSPDRSETGFCEESLIESIAASSAAGNSTGSLQCGTANQRLILDKILEIRLNRPKEG
ncbi:MAG: clostripain-related cysteine peptidase [Candidatus Wallbacteria bacterium]|nr:clostripain-related cysteine peptidase [Candidatus Wallbacteria bacterium]